MRRPKRATRLSRHAVVGCIFAEILSSHTASAQHAYPPTVVPPRAVRVIEAQIPSELSRGPESATPRSVLVRLSLDSSGRVRDLAVVTSSGESALDERAMAALRESEFAPATQDGVAIAVQIHYRYVFVSRSQRALDEDAPRPRAVTRTVTTPRTQGSQPALPEQSVTVYGRVPSREMLGREVTADDVRRIPGARGDALLAVQNLPGVGRSQFGLGQFVLRSSPPEDSLALLEGHPIALPFHLYGLSSSIATDLIERIEVLPGNFSARFGRVAGGVVQVTLRAPARDRVHVAADVDLIDAGLFASVPLGRRGSLAAGLRGSYLSLLAQAALPPGSSSFRQWPSYWDWQLALDWDFSDRDSVRVVASGTDDGFVTELTQPDPNDPSIRGTFGTHLAQHGLQARWRHRVSPSTTHTLSLAGAYQLQDVQLGPSVRYRFEALTASLRDELDYTLSRTARLFVGLDVQALRSDDRVQAPPTSPSGLADPISATTLVQYQALRVALNPALYTELALDPTPTVHVLAGIRAEHFSLARSSTVDPRASAQWMVHPRVALRGALGGYSTPPKGYASIPGFGNPDLRPERWLHASAAVSWQALPGAIELDITGFVKAGASVISPSDRVLTRDHVPTPERFSNDGVGRVYGAEFMARLRPGRLPIFALVSYTLQRAERAVCARCAWTTYTFDQPHNLSVTLGGVFAFGLEAGVRVRVTSGLVEPVVRGAVYDLERDVSLTLVDPRTTARLPAFFSLDVRVAWRFRTGAVRWQLIAEVLNATAQDNVESRVYSFDRRESRPVLGLPILPTLGVRIEY
ncbi:MAG: TonB-dependent receptor [Deltaproteobacteria bacterium]|nr:TonB-dependent receptor [Deltaproteobacteria bacterium]